MSGAVVDLQELHAMEQVCWRKAKRKPRSQRYDYMIECMRKALRDMRGGT